MNELGTYLRNIRKQKHLSMTNVRNATGITNSRMSRIERGLNKSSPPIEDLLQLATLYGINPDTLITKANYTKTSENRTLLNNVELLNADELQYIQKAIDFILSQKGRL